MHQQTCISKQTLSLLKMHLWCIGDDVCLPKVIPHRDRMAMSSWTSFNLQLLELQAVWLNVSFTEFALCGKHFDYSHFQANEKYMSNVRMKMEKEEKTSPHMYDIEVL